MTICIFIIIYERMAEIYLMTSVSPIPMATMLNRKWRQKDQNYLRSLFALGFQVFLFIICVGIYAEAHSEMAAEAIPKEFARGR